MLACVEVGGSGVQTVLLSGDATPRIIPGAHHPAGSTLLLAAPGHVVGGLAHAVNLGWAGVDPALELGLGASADLVLNDAESAALGESVLRDGAELLYLGLGTGVGAAVVQDGVATGNLLAHRTDLVFSSATCRCGAVGCLEAVAGGWSLPRRLTSYHLAAVAANLAVAVMNDPATRGVHRVVLGGGLVRSHPALVGRLAGLLDRRTVEASAAPAGAKSAAAWGLRAAWQAVPQPV